MSVLLVLVTFPQPPAYENVAVVPLSEMAVRTLYAVRFEYVMC